MRVVLDQSEVSTITTFIYYCSKLETIITELYYY